MSAALPGGTTGPGGATGPGAAIRAAGPQDLDDLAALHGACFAEAWDRAALAELMAMPGAQALIARPELRAEAPEADRTGADGTGAGGPPPAQGFVILRWVAEEAEIISIGVRPAVRRRGLGRRLLAAAAATAAGAGARQLFLEVAADNRPALALYLGFGFTQVGRRASYYRDDRNGPIAALVLAKPLAPPVVPG